MRSNHFYDNGCGGDGFSPEGGEEGLSSIPLGSGQGDFGVPAGDGCGHGDHRLLDLFSHWSGDRYRSRDGPWPVMD